MTGTSPLGKTLQALGSGLVRPDSISAMKVPLATVSPQQQSAIKTTVVGTSKLNAASALVLQVASMYLMSGSNEEFLAHLGTATFNAVLTPTIVRAAAHKLGVDRYVDVDQILVPVTQAAVSIAGPLTARHFVTYAATPPPSTSAPGQNATRIPEQPALTETAKPTTVVSNIPNVTATPTPPPLISPPGAGYTPETPAAFNIEEEIAFINLGPQQASPPIAAPQIAPEIPEQPAFAEATLPRDPGLHMPRPTQMTTPLQNMTAQNAAFTTARSEIKVPAAEPSYSRSAWKATQAWAESYALWAGSWFGKNQ